MPATNANITNNHRQRNQRGRDDLRFICFSVGSQHQHALEHTPHGSVAAVAPPNHPHHGMSQATTNPKHIQ